MAEKNNDLGNDDFADDDDAIDKLLMDDMFSDDDNSETSEQNLAEIDEFADEEVDEFSVNDDSETAVNTELENSVMPEQGEESVLSTDDSYLDDFDITSDDDELFSETATPSEEVSEDTTESEPPAISEAPDMDTDKSNNFEPDSEAIQEQDILSEQPSEEQEAPIVEESNENPPVSDSVIGEALTAQVSQLWTEVLDLKEQHSDPSDEIEQLKKKLKRTSQDHDEVSQKNKLLTGLAMGLAAIASIIAIVSLVQNSNLKSSISDLNIMIADMEEAALGPDITTEKTIQSLKDSNLVLDNNQQGLMTQLAELKNLLETQNGLSEDEITLKNSLSSLENNVTEINKKVEGLAVSVTKLQKRRTKASVAKKPTKTKANPAADWSVNLVSFKQDWYARKKASEFKNKGIPVEVIQVLVKGEQWYRLRVPGFKTKYEAEAYASRAKKALNLSSVWVIQK